ncbi:MAG: response regulator [Fibrobacterota bacterium]|nr:MAG: response regulator [Fibrobacterota bacterium]
MGYTVLLVDDSETIRGALLKAFQMAKLPMEEVFQAADGREALDKLKSVWVDMVLTDINMPNMGGVELLAAMKADPSLKDIPVAVISTEGSSTRIQSLQEAGIAGYLRKPCRPEEIRDLLHKVLGDWK